MAKDIYLLLNFLSDRHMCNYDNSIDEADDWIIFSIDRLDNAKIVSGSD